MRCLVLPTAAGSPCGAPAPHRARVLVASPRRRKPSLTGLLALALAGCTPTAKVVVDHGLGNPLPEDRLVVDDATVGGGPWTRGDYGGAIIYPTIGDPKSFNWIVNNDQSTSDVGRISFADLVSINEFTQRTEPELAKSFEIASDRRSITLTLRRGLQWSDGEPFGLKDVLHTWRAIWNPHVSTPARDSFAIRPEGDTEERYFWLSVLDDDTLRMTAPSPYAILDRVLSEIWMVPEHELPPMPPPPSVEDAGFVISLPTLYQRASRSADLKMYWEVWFRPELERLSRIVEDGADQDPLNLGRLAAFEALLPAWDSLMTTWASDFSSSWSTDLAVDPASAAEHLCTMGPFQIAQYVTGQYAVFTPNPFYWKVDTAGKRLPYLNKIYMWTVQNQDTMMVKFSSGEGDMLCPVLPIDVAALRKLQTDHGFTVHEVGPRLVDNHIYFNMNQAWRLTLAAKNAAGEDEDRIYFRYPDAPAIADRFYEDFNVEVKDVDLLARLRASSDWKPIVEPAKASAFQNVGFRRAVSALVDREAIAQNIFAGLAVPLSTSIGPGYKDWFNDDVAKFPYDPKKAEEYLDQAGMSRRGADGWRLAPNGEPLSFTIITNANNEQRVQIGTLLAGELQKVKINATVQPLDFNVLLTKLQSSFDYDCTILSLGGGDVDQASNGNVWRSSGFTHVWAPKQPVPMTEAEAQSDRLFDTVLTGATLAERVAAMHEIERLWAEQQFLIHTYANTLFVASRNDVQNLRPALMEMNVLWNAAWLYRAASPGPPAGGGSVASPTAP